MADWWVKCRGRQCRHLIRVIRGWHDVVHPWLWLGHVLHDVRVVVSAVGICSSICMILNEYIT